ncbi:hypothetical protein [Caldivirga sp.]|uniref:hypothetical protein n=1 Tax=Caldivirga sp. TaxID=2080243 RepID=UPI0025B91D5A|nr:hypothetical protein [Caldivirga sp.]
MPSARLIIASVMLALAALIITLNAVNYITTVSKIPNTVREAIQNIKYGFSSYRYSINESVKGQSLALPTVTYIIGPGWFIRSIINISSSPALVKAINISQLSSLPNESIIIIDWDYVSGVTQLTPSQLAELLETPIGHGDLVILYTNHPRIVPLLEDVASVAWGKHFRSHIIGYPVMHVNGPAYIIAFGGRNYLVVSPIQVRMGYVLTINGLIEEWVKANSTTPLTQGSPSDPTYVNQDPCSVARGYLSSNNWLIATGQQSYTDSETNNQYAFDYCILGANYYQGEGNTISVNYLGFSNYYVSGSNPYANSGSFQYYNVGINMTTGYTIDVLNGYNSYMTWTGATSAAQPSNTGCSWFSYSELELILDLASESLEFLYEAEVAGDPIASLTSTLTIVGGPEMTANLAWFIGVENPNWFCTSASTEANAYYPVGFGVTDFQGSWQINPSTVNTAASPVYWSSGLVCYSTSNGGLWEAFQSSIYFILQFNPTGNPQVSEQSINYYTQGPIGVYPLPVETPCSS